MAFDIAPYSGAISSVADLLNGVLKRVLPEKMSESEKAQLQQQVTLELMKADWSSVNAEFQDRASARQLAEKDVDRGNWVSNFLAATVRPIWGYASLVVVAYPYLAGALHWPAVTIDENTKSIIQTVIMFYFGGRTIEKVITGKTPWK